LTGDQDPWTPLHRLDWGLGLMDPRLVTPWLGGRDPRTPLHRLDWGVGTHGPPPSDTLTEGQDSGSHEGLSVGANLW